MKMTLEALGFEEQTAADECLYVHPTREIDLGLYVDDIEASASEENLEWLKAQLAKRYLIKFLGYNSKDCAESSNKSKTYVGVRTEIDHANKIVTQDQQELIERGARKLEWDGRKRWSPPTTKGLVPLEKDAKAIEIPKETIEERVDSKVSLMPEGLLNTLTKQEIFDLLLYIESAGDANSPVYQ